MSKANQVPNGVWFAFDDTGVKMNSRKYEKNKKARITILFLLVVSAIFVYKNSITLFDHYVIWRNPPSPAIVELANKTGMSNLGRRIFFASVPSFDDAEELNANCSDIETTMVILGCYARGRIHVFNVRDERIAAAKYVTSAHEMLHAAYVRLSKSERNRINTLLEESYQYIRGDDELRDLMAEYARMEPEQRHNELHSILGAEHAELFSELEDYYARYFTDRGRIVEMAFQYRKVFKNLEDEQAQLKVQLDRLAASIETNTSLLDTMILWLNRDIDDFNNKEFRSRSEFNNGRMALIEKQRELNRFKARIEADIAQFDAWVKEYNSLGGKIDQLTYQIDSKSQAGVREIKDGSAF